jgi:DNA-binding XRE family transcriptional regulator
MHCVAQGVDLGLYRPVAKPTPHREHLYDAESYRQLQARFIANVRRVRDADGLTQEEAAARCGMPMQQFQQLESGKANVTLRTLGRVAEGLGVDVAEFFRVVPTATMES